MNKKAILRTAKAIETAQFVTLGFNMFNWLSTTAPDLSGRDCGTTACIAGWVVAAHRGLKSYKAIYDGGGVLRHARSIIEISRDEADVLFEQQYQNDKVTPEVAVTVLRHFAETGEIGFQQAIDGELP